MKIKINNEIKDFADGINLSDLVNQLNLKESRGLAIALNQNVIQRKHWRATTLKENDKILVITATSGG